MNKNITKGLTLAEIMIIFFILSVCLAAAVPFFTKHASRNSNGGIENEDSGEDLSVNGKLPVGTIILYAGKNVPNGWKKCNGSAIQRSKFPKLYKAIGNKYGAGDNSTTFNLPNLSNFMNTTVPSTNYNPEGMTQQTESMVLNDPTDPSSGQHYYPGPPADSYNQPSIPTIKYIIKY